MCCVLLRRCFFGVCLVFSLTGDIDASSKRWVVDESNGELKRVGCGLGGAVGLVM